MGSEIFDDIHGLGSHSVTIDTDGAREAAKMKEILDVGDSVSVVVDATPPVGLNSQQTRDYFLATAAGDIDSTERINGTVIEVHRDDNRALQKVVVGVSDRGNITIEGEGLNWKLLTPLTPVRKFS